MTRYLPRLFGGPLDGDTRVLDPHTRHFGRLVVPVKGPRRAQPIENAFRPTIGSTYTEEVYRRHLLASTSDGPVLEVFAHEGMSQGEVWRRVWQHLLDRAGASYA